MSWFKGYETYSGLFLRICYEIIKAGDMPKHIGFIMDGNRRFAKQEKIRTKDGHTKGFEKLTEVLHWCHELNIPEVTVYAFSIENFKRSSEEVEALLSIFKDKVSRLLDEQDVIAKNGVCINFVGNVLMFDEDIRELMSKVVHMTKHHKRSVLNIAVAYTSREEITEAVKEVVLGVHNGHILPSDVNEELLEGCFYTSKSRPLDLLIRTSGEVRLSDFLLWQSSHSLICFVKPLWPEFSVWSFFTCILKYQLGYDDFKSWKLSSEDKAQRKQYESDCSETLKEMRCTADDPSFNSATRHYTEKRKHRCALFLNDVRKKRDNLFFPQST